MKREVRIGIGIFVCVCVAEQAFAQEVSSEDLLLLQVLRVEHAAEHPCTVTAYALSRKPSKRTGEQL